MIYGGNVLVYKPQPKMKMYKGYEVLNKADIEDN